MTTIPVAFLVPSSRDQTPQPHRATRTQTPGSPAPGKASPGGGFTPGHRMLSRTPPERRLSAPRGTEPTSRGRTPSLRAPATALPSCETTRGQLRRGGGEARLPAAAEESRLRAPSIHPALVRRNRNGTKPVVRATTTSPIARGRRRPPADPGGKDLLGITVPAPAATEKPRGWGGSGSPYHPSSDGKGTRGDSFREENRTATPTSSSRPPRPPPSSTASRVSMISTTTRCSPQQTWRRISRIDTELAAYAPLGHGVARCGRNADPALATKEQSFLGPSSCLRRQRRVCAGHVLILWAVGDGIVQNACSRVPGPPSAFPSSSPTPIIWAASR